MEKDDRFSSPPPPAIDFSFAKAPSFKPRSQQNQTDKPESTRSTPGIFSGPSFSPAERVKYSSLRAEVRPPRSSPLQRSAELSTPAALPAAIPLDTRHISLPSFRIQQHAAVSSYTPEKPEDPTLPSLHSNRGQFGGSTLELPSPLMKIPPSNSLSYSNMSTPSTKERLLQRKRQSMGSRNIDSPMSPSPNIQSLSNSNHSFSLLTGTSQAQSTHHQNETRLNSSGTCLPDVLTTNTAIANVQRKQEPPSSRHTSLARDSNSMAEAGSSGNRSISHAPTESNPGIGLAFDMIKNIEEENVRLKADVHELSSRLESVQAEADGLSAKNKALQHKSKEAVETAAEKLDANYRDLQALKAQCASQTAVLEELKVAKSDYGHLREHVQASLAEIRPLIEVSDESLGESTVARQIVSDIRNEVQTVTGESERKQHVVDLLREQLMSCTGDLSEARDRVLALETELSKSRMTLDKTVDEVNMATSKISVLANELKAQQHETILALTRAGELQASVTTAESEILDLRSKLRDSDALNHTLRTEYAVLQQTHQQTANEASRIPNLEARIQSLSAAEATLKSKDEFISDLQTRLSSSGAIEAEVKARDNTIVELRALLNSAEASERANKVRIATLEHAQSKLELVAAENVELQKAADRSLVFETNLASTKKELETEKAIRIKAMRDAEVAEQQKSSLDQALQSMQDKLQRSNTRYEISEQRRVDQVEDLSNRIVTYETQLTTARENLSTYSSQVASLSASLAEIRLVVDKREAEAARLQDAVRTHASTNAEQTATITQLRAELKEQSQSLKSVESLHTTHQARVVTLERELRESGERLAEATIKLQASEAEINSLKVEAQAPRQDDEVNRLNEEVESVRKRAEAAEAKVAGQEEGFKTMVTRFRAREQLSDLETSVIRDVVPLVRAQCETELLTHINEIKGRDTTISKLTTRIAQLEAQLDKALKGSETAEVSLQNGTSGTGGGFQPLEVSTPLSEPPVPDADQVTTDSTPPSPPPTTRPISYAVPQGVPGRQYGSSRPAAAIARHKFTELNKPSLSSEDAIQGTSSDDIAHSKAQGPGVRRVKRTHDDMEYDDEIEEDEDENVMPLKGAASKTRTTKSTRRPSVQGKPVATSLATGGNNTGASKTRGKKRR